MFHEKQMKDSGNGGDGALDAATDEASATRVELSVTGSLKIQGYYSAGDFWAQGSQSRKVQ